MRAEGRNDEKAPVMEVTAMRARVKKAIVGIDSRVFRLWTDRTGDCFREKWWRGVGEV